MRGGLLAALNRAPGVAGFKEYVKIGSWSLFIEVQQRFPESLKNDTQSEGEQRIGVTLQENSKRPEEPSFRKDSERKRSRLRTDLRARCELAGMSSLSKPVPPGLSASPFLVWKKKNQTRAKQGLCFREQPRKVSFKS